MILIAYNIEAAAITTLLRKTTTAGRFALAAAPAFGGDPVPPVPPLSVPFPLGPFATGPGAGAGTGALELGGEGGVLCGRSVMMIRLELAQCPAIGMSL